MAAPPRPVERVGCDDGGHRDPMVFVQIGSILGALTTSTFAFGSESYCLGAPLRSLRAHAWSALLHARGRIRLRAPQRLRWRPALLVRRSWRCGLFDGVTSPPLPDGALRALLAAFPPALTPEGSRALRRSCARDSSALNRRSLAGEQQDAEVGEARVGAVLAPQIGETPRRRERLAGAARSWTKVSVLPP